MLWGPNLFLRDRDFMSRLSVSVFLTLSMQMPGEYVVIIVIKDAPCFPETSVHINKVARRHIPRSYLCNDLCENPILQYVYAGENSLFIHFSDPIMWTMKNAFKWTTNITYLSHIFTDLCKPILCWVFYMSTSTSPVRNYSQPWANKPKHQDISHLQREWAAVCL